MLQPIPLAIFEARTGISRDTITPFWSNAFGIVALRDIVSVQSIQVMSEEYLRKILHNTSLEGNEKLRAYEGCTIQRARLDPHNMLVGQTFVERAKCRQMLEHLSGIFDGFCVSRGFAKSIPLIILGTTKDGLCAIAHYLPPIVEQHNGGLYLLDGVHRCYLVSAIGTTIEAIVLKGVQIPFPCDVHTWASLRPVDEKPPSSERFYNLRPDIFRDLKWVGVDG
ncbi:MAG: hypothetical protein HYT94_02390 [Parcubacteria group bacterium]|nr:hypothetical protein [Parcubacteria group bacterium]